MRLIAACLILLVFASCGNQKIANYSGQGVQVDSTVADSDLEGLIAPYRSSMEKQMTLVIGSSVTTLEGAAPESTLGNFAAKAVYLAGVKYGNETKDIGPDAMKNCFSLLNFGGLRSVINTGDVSIGNMYELMPFDNTLTLVKLSGDDVRKCAQYLFAQHGQPVHNATFRLSSNSEQMTINGAAYNFDEDVVVITSNYLASGGDKMDFFKNPIRKWDSGIFIRDIFIEYVQEVKKIEANEIQGKFHFVKE